MRTTPPLRATMAELIRQGLGRRVNLPPTRPDRWMSLRCLNPDCQERASVNYRLNAYNCRHCPVKGDAVSLIMHLARSQFDPYRELSGPELAGIAYDWAEGCGLTSPDVPGNAPYRPAFAAVPDDD